jgi:hypothetical protein
MRREEWVIPSQLSGQSPERQCKRIEYAFKLVTYREQSSYPVGDIDPGLLNVEISVKHY